MTENRNIGVRAKLPYMQLFPADWIGDEVAGCSWAAQGLWLRMMFIMHQSPEYGRLTLNGKPMPADMVARKCGGGMLEYQAALAELMDAGVPSIGADGVMYSRRMVRDEARRRSDTVRQRRHRGDCHGACHGDVTPQKSEVRVQSKTHREAGAQLLLGAEANPEASEGPAKGEARNGPERAGLGVRETGELAFEGRLVRITAQEMAELISRFPELALLESLREYDLYLEAHPAKKPQSTYRGALNWCRIERRIRKEGGSNGRPTAIGQNAGKPTGAVPAKPGKYAGLEATRMQ